MIEHLAIIMDGTVDRCFVAVTDGDPCFKNAAAGDFHLYSSSPAKDIA